MTDVMNKGITLALTATFYKPDVPAHRFPDSAKADLKEVVEIGMQAKGYQAVDVSVSEVEGQEGAKDTQ